MEKLIKFYAFRKENSTYACVGITEKAAKTKTIMKKLSKLYPVEITENEYNEMKKGNYSILTENEYNEREEKQKKPVKKFNDTNLIKTFIPKKGKITCITFDQKNKKAYITDSFRIYKTGIENIKNVLDEKEYIYNETDENIAIFHKCKNASNDKKIVHDIKKIFESHLLKAKKVYATETVPNPFYLKDKYETSASFFHAYKHFFDIDYLKNVEKSKINTKTCKMVTDSYSYGVAFFENEKNEMVYMTMSLRFDYMDIYFQKVQETKEVETPTETPAEEKETEISYKLSEKDAEKALETYNDVYSYVYNMPELESDERYRQTVMKADSLLCNSKNEFHKFVNFLAEKRQDFFSSDRELFSVYAAFIEFKNSKNDSYIHETIKKSKTYANFLKNVSKATGDTRQELNEVINQMVEKIDEKEPQPLQGKSQKRLCEKSPENHKEIEVPGKFEIETDAKNEEPKRIEEMEAKEEPGKPEKSLSAISAIAPISSQKSKKESVIISNIQKKDDLTFVEKLKEIKNDDISAAYIGTSAKEKEPVYIDFKKSTHLMVAGATGSGKSVMINSIISSLMFKNTADTAQFLLIDPKRVEFFDYSTSNLLYGGKVYEDVSEGISALENVMYEMNDRYIQLKYMHVRSIDDLPCGSKMPRIYVCIDEFSFFMLEDRKKIENIISKIGMLGRAAGIHLILATQHPDRKVITGSIQANIPTVIGLATRKAVDSRMVTGSNICTKLKGHGDAVLIDGLEEVHFQGAFVSSDDIQEIVNTSGIENSRITQNISYIPDKFKKTLNQFKS